MAEEAHFPEVLLVHLAPVAAADRFFDARWPEARAVSDPGKHLYRAFGLGKAPLAWLAGFRVWGPGLRALLSGHGPGRIIGDPHWRSGAFLVRDGAVVWEHHPAHSGDRWPWEELPGRE